jgi:predicted small secreted protein
MRRSRGWSVVGVTLALLFSLGLAACGDTWRGMKQDTGDNMEAVGETLDKSGEKVEESAQ